MQRDLVLFCLNALVGNGVPFCHDPVHDERFRLLCRCERCCHRYRCIADSYEASAPSADVRRSAYWALDSHVPVHHVCTTHHTRQNQICTLRSFHGVACSCLSKHADLCSHKAERSLPLHLVFNISSAAADGRRPVHATRLHTRLRTQETSCKEKPGGRK